jgi:outer membrane protein TolC
LSQLRFKEGVISFLDVLDAQRTLYVAEIELARSEAAASTHLVAVYKALGGGAKATEAQSSKS